MDELVHHCIHELAFEGDLGCDVSHLRDFIQDFYKHNTITQKVDDAYCAFVWSVVVQQPEVRVGIAPEGAREVYIAPQQSKQTAADKSKKKGDNVPAPGDESLPGASLELVEDAAVRPLEDLKAQYGDALRIAVDPERSFVAITGSHIRPSKLTPMVFTALQLISRGREKGISVVDLARKTGYDQKTKAGGYDPRTCHYLVDKLLELDLIVKMKKSGVGANFCIHKYFFERSDIWKNVKAEEQGAIQALEEFGEADLDGDEPAATPASQSGMLQFTPISKDHLSSLPLVRARLELLLKNSPSHMHRAQNLLVTIGYSNPPKTDRRFFQTQLNELVKQRVVEKVKVPVAHAKNKIVCIRLRSPDAEEPQEDFESEEEIPTLKSNVTLHRQIVDLIEQSGIEGTTLNELSKALCNFDKRIIEHQLVRLQQDPPSHLADLRIMQLGETHGRERRYKYFTAGNFRAVAEREGLASQDPADYANVGDFMDVDEQAFYKTDADFAAYVDNFPFFKDAKGKSKSKKKTTNPILADGSVKKGRPRKSDAEKAYGRKRKRKDEIEATDDAGIAEATGEPPAKRPRGRPRKSLPAPDVPTWTAVEGEPTDDNPLASASASISAPVPKRRGRPPKPRPPEGITAGDGASAAGPSTPAEPKRKRGRPRKIRPEEPQDQAPAVPKKRGRPRKIRPEDVQPGPSEPVPPDGAVDRPLPDDAAEESLTEAEQVQEASVPVDGAIVPSTPAPEHLAEQPDPLPPQVKPATPTTTAAAVEHATPPPAGPSDASTPVSPQTARIRRSTRVRKPRARDDEPQSVTSTPTPAHRRQERVAPSQSQYKPSAMEVDSEPPPPPAADQLALEEAAAVHDSASQTQDVTMADSSGQQPDVSALPDGTPIFDSTTEAALVDPNTQTQPTAVSENIPAATSVPPPPEISQQKRSEPDSPSVQPPPKKARTSGAHTGYRGKLNISQSRREKEILRVIQDAGGLLNIGTKEVYEAHAALVDTLTKAGEPTSTLPGSRIDKRTLESTLRDLESQGKIKLVTTAVQSATGVSRQVKVARLADVSDEAFTAFLVGLNNTSVTVAQPIFKTLDEPVAYGGGKSQRVVRPAAATGLLNIDLNAVDASQAVDKLLEADEKVIQASLLTEPETVVQLYGFLNGKMARAKALHMHTVGVFAGQNTSSIVSAEHRIVNLSYYTLDMPVSVSCSIISCRAQNEELLELLKTSEGRQTPVGQLPANIADDLGVSKSRWRTSLMSLFQILYSLNLVIPLVPSQEPTPFLTCSPNGDHFTAFDKTTYDGAATLMVPQYWQFVDNAPLHLWALTKRDPVFWKTVSVQDAPGAAQYWEDLMRVSTDVEFARTAPPANDQTQAQPVHLNVSSTMSKLFKRVTQWRSSYRFSFLQKQYLRQHMNGATGETPLQDDDRDARIERIATTASIPIEDVVKFFERERNKILRLIDRNKAFEEQARQAEERAILAQKAAEAQAQRERDWEAILNRIHPEPITNALVPRIRQIKSRFMQTFTVDVSKWEAEIAAAVEEARNATLAGPSGPLLRPIVHVQPRPAPLPPTPLPPVPLPPASLPPAPLPPAPLPPAPLPPASLPPTSLPPASLTPTPLTPTPLTPAPLPPASLPLISLSPAPLPPAIQSHDKPIEELITLQGPPIPPTPAKGKKKSKGKDKEKNLAVDAEDGNGRSRRRHRFQWNKDFDELARDASVIIRARCRDGKRLDWAGLEQAFPAVPRNSVRQRISGLREQPGAEAYFKRLEDRWYELWHAHRGTPELPDENPTSPSKFDIIAHIKFLRKYIDKNALRVGFSQEETPITAVLPLQANELLERWDVVEKVDAAVSWDFMWNGLAEEGRERQFIQRAFLAGGNEIPATKRYFSESVYVADAALKMTLSTPNETYDSENASRLLTSVGEASVTAAVTELLDSSALSRVVRDPKKIKPGRTLKISEMNQNALGGSMHEDIFQEAAALEDLLSQQDEAWQEWPLTASDGDTAALIELVSENKIELKVDITRTRAARAKLDWNSKKTDDDDIETSIEIRLKDAPSRPIDTAAPEDTIATTDAPTSPTPGTDTEAVHDSVNVQGRKACCRRTSAGPSDCVACLDAQLDQMLGGMQDQSRFHRRLAAVLQEAGASGITKTQLLDVFDVSERDLLTTAVAGMVSADIPLAYWQGYDEIVVVSAYHITPWTVLISENDMDCTRIFPRRWLDIDGHMLSEVWEAARRAAISTILFHPGIAQAELRWRLRAVYDRQEVEDVLAHLVDQGYVERHIEGHHVFSPSLASNDEEKSVFWKIGKRCWYTL